MDYAHLNEKWRFRFEFFDANGMPGTPTYKLALKALPFMQKIKVNSNLIAWFFGPIYFFVLGLWRKNLVLIGISIMLGVILSFLPDAVGRVGGFVMAAIYAQIANHAYYLKLVKGEDGWNPFSCVRWW